MQTRSRSTLSVFPRRFKQIQGASALRLTAIATLPPAGYGGKEVAELLIAAGAQIDAVNAANQMPVNAAKMNREMHMVEFLVKKKLELAKASEATAGPDAGQCSNSTPLEA